ncbi:MAG: type II secretion system F family protein [Bryobacteraceae bacterium]
MLTLLIAGVFGATFLVVAAAVVLYWRTGSDAEPESDGEPRETLHQPINWLAPVEASGGILKADSLSSITALDQLLARVNGIERMRHALAEAGMNWSVGRITAMMLLAGAATFVVLWPMLWAPRWLKLGAAAVAASTPYLIVRRRRRKRLVLFERQFPEALDTLSRAMRAGNPFAVALDLVARETAAPLGPELRKTVDERKLGLSWEVALGHLADRVPVVEVNIFVAAVQLQTRTGGKLHEVVGKLAETMRESSSLKGEVRSIAAHGKLTGAILTVLPMAIAGIMAFVNPTSLLVLWNDPTGNQLIWVAGGCLIAAHMVIQKLVDVRL